MYMYTCVCVNICICIYVCVCMHIFKCRAPHMNRHELIWTGSPRNSKSKSLEFHMHIYILDKTAVKVHQFWPWGQVERPFRLSPRSGSMGPGPGVSLLSSAPWPWGPRIGRGFEFLSLGGLELNQGSRFCGLA